MIKLITDDMWKLIITVIVVLLAATLFEKSGKKKRNKRKNTNEIMPDEKPPYRPKKIFTKAEYSFYMSLNNFIRNDVIILPKVGLKEFLYIPSNTEKYGTHWAKISQKHVDFLICDKESLYIYCAVELDDKSHEDAERKERDQFVDEAIRGAGLAVLHIPCKFAYEINDIQPINDIVQYKKQNQEVTA